MPCRRSMIPGSRMQLWTFLADRTYQRDIKPVPTLSCGGVFRYRSGERLHGMQEVSGSIPLFSTKKALYFVGSMVLFFFVPAKRSGVHRSPCRRASDTPDLHNSRHLPCRFNRGFRGQHGAGPTAPAPAWQALAGARAVRQRGRRRKKKFLRRKVCVAAVVSPGKMTRRFTSFWERSI